MSTVTVPTALGGSGIVYSDDGTGVRDMRDGGHRQWLLPMVGEQIAAAQVAVDAASSTLGAASTQATSTTSLAIGTGSKALTVQTGKNFLIGMPVRIAYSETAYMDGEVSAYTSGTGALTVLVASVAGSGTYADWDVFLTGANGATNPAGGAASAAITTATTLTASSERVRPVAMTTDAQSVTLPDATTLNEGGPLFVLPNTGNRPFAVRANGGTMLTAVQPGGVVELYLRDNGTAAGAWSVSGVGLSPALTIVDATLASTLTQSVETVVRLTDSLSLHFARNASGHPFVCAVDHSPGGLGVGTAVLIVASSATVAQALRISNSKAAIVVDGTSSNVYNVTVSGVTCTVSAAATAAVFDQATFTGQPQIAQLGANGDLLVAIDVSGGAVRAQAVDCSGSNPSAGSSTNIVASGGQAISALYRVSDTTALALYVDDSGSAGSPHSLRGVVLSLSGTTVTVGTSAGVNDILGTGGFSGTVGPPSCALSATSYVVGYYQASGTLFRAVHVGVSGTTVTFGTPLTVETQSIAGNYSYTDLNSNRFQPLLFALTATTALMTWGDSGAFLISRHAVITNSAGTLSVGTILYGLWDRDAGGNFPQAADGFLAMQEQSTAARISNVTISGSTLTVTGTALPPGVVFNETSTQRFGLSGGVRAIRQSAGNGPSIGSPSNWNAFRVTQGAGPRHLGAFNVPNFNGNEVPVEVAANKAAFTSSTLSQNGSATALIKVAIVEFAA